MAENNASHDQNERMEDGRSSGSVADGPIRVGGSGGNGASGIAALKPEAEAARMLIAALNIGDDDDLVETTIEGETGLMEAIDAALLRIVELEAMASGIEDAVDVMKTRQSRMKSGAERLRGSLLLAMDTAGLKKTERPTATLSLAKGADKAIVHAESELPSHFLIEKTTVAPDKKAILAALKAGEDVPGAHMSNGGVNLRILPR